MSDDPYIWALRVHWVAGGVALLVAPLAMAVRKGGRWHRRWGKAFVYAMAIVCVTAIAISIPKDNYLMALVAVFSFHLTATGWRALYLKKLHKGQRPTAVDWLLHGTAGAFNFCLLVWGLGGLLLGHDRDPFYVIFTVFGTIGTLLVVGQVRKFYQNKHERHQWFFDHIVGMIAGYIATVSAFSAVNLAPLVPDEFVAGAWLWPTLIGTPAIGLTTRYFRRKFSNGRTPHDSYKVKIR